MDPLEKAQKVDEQQPKTNQPTTLSEPATQWLPLDLTKGFFQDSVQNDDTVLKVSLGLSISEEENQDYWTDGSCA